MSLGKKFTKRVETWGDTRNPEGEGRRIYIGQHPQDAKPDDFLNFFGRELVDGVTVSNYYAFVQFKRPKDKTFWITKRTTNFMGKTITIRDYVPDSTRGSKIESRRPPSRALVPRRSRSRSRSYDRSSHRERSRERGRDDESHRSRRHDRERARSRSSDRVSNAKPSCRDDHRSTGRASSKLAPDYFSDHTFGESLQSVAPWIEQRPMNTGSGLLMPYSIELYLKLALDRGTFRNLSLIQFDEILSFIKSERDFVQQSTAPTSWGFAQTAQPGPVATINYHPESLTYPQLQHSTTLPEIKQSVIYPAIQQDLQEPPRELQPTPPADKQDEIPEQDEAIEATDDIKPEPKKIRPSGIAATVDLIRKAMKKSS